MKNRIAFSLGMFLVITLTPFFSSAQDAASTDPGFTGHAFLMGFLILSVIILVFLGLLLTARVNELRAFLKRKSQEVNKRDSTWKRLMSLDQTEINDITKLRQERQNVSKL
jgi:hypothetical protein